MILRSMDTHNRSLSQPLSYYVLNATGVQRTLIRQGYQLTISAHTARLMILN
jgi:hypothetical protein